MSYRGREGRIGTMIATMAVAFVARETWNALAVPSYGWISFDSSEAGRAFPGMVTIPEDDSGNRRDVSLALSQARSRYPSRSMDVWVKRVFVVRRLSYDGQSMGATNDPVGRNLIVETDALDVDPEWTRSSFHHELGHLLKDALPKDFPDASWRGDNAKGFRYAEDDGKGDGFDAIARGKDGLDLDDGLNAKGVLSEYASSSIDEDWACTAERIMMGDRDYWARVARYPLLRKKARLAVAFYRKAMPGIAIPDLPKGW